ncbi:hypothetical protein LACR_2119 [Lactococcus cremoris subsp. cremoris SK11]|uniref:Uncharacterized protein n=3 Tax=Lactococcus lactis subsp. cremoris TaxID=1359 RepID=Q02WS8_LACLS|nr:hypothetical protein [Lactococcus cremoris]ABJ73594.1 hypothetical protein LACR_2119 [Lactococcus cremoris subsp. cremoris SK11]ARE24209.1 hypothetical protein LLJM3_2032 [Lactococcus cremoris]KZK48033.1 hypothetical protein SK110_0876 [Lactococcus cremoris]KZK52509.1 hypothetical protein AM2_2051 [Lactococcus cremoris]MCT0446362.1 hypothetical protein [Lactococcus cremoris]
MNDKKYYVKLKSPNNHKGIWWCGDRSEWQSYSDDPVYGEELDDWGEREVIGWKVSEFIPSFTKSELSKIMGGAFYITLHQKSFTVPLVMGRNWIWSDELQVYEWINPLIELVPVEDGE